MLVVCWMSCGHLHYDGAKVHHCHRGWSFHFSTQKIHPCDISKGRRLDFLHYCRINTNQFEINSNLTLACTSPHFTSTDRTPLLQTQGQEYAQSLVESCNTSRGFSAELFGRLIDSAETERQKAARKKRKDVVRKLEEVYDGTRKMTSSICFEDGGILNEDAMIAVMSYNSSKKREREKKDERKAVKRRKTFEDANTFSGDGESTVRIHCCSVESIE